LEDEEELEEKEKQKRIHRVKTKEAKTKKDKDKDKIENEIERKSDVLFIGCETSLMCYDIMENKTLFDREITEGVLCMVCGKFSSFKEPLCLAGGNCNIIGVDINGEDKFWTVLGGNTICMDLGDFNKDNKNELFVGTDDFTIRIYKDEEPILEINENTKIIIIAPIEDDYFIYGLETGTIGLYKGNIKTWSKKEKGYCTSIYLKDFIKEETYEALIGMSTGKIILLDANTGREILSFYIDHAVSKFFYGDFTLSLRQMNENINDNKNIDEDDDEKDRIICFSENGDVYGYCYGEKDYIVTEREFISKDKKVSEQDLNEYEKLIKEKNRLLDELEDLAVKESNKSKINAAKEENNIPSDLTVNIDLESNDEDKCADLILEATKGGIIKMIIIVSEQIYQGETFVKYPKDETSKAIVQIKTKKDLNINLHIKVLVGMNSFLDDYQVLEFNKIIPKYCFYILLREENEYVSKIAQGISLDYNDRVDRLIIFLEASFNIPKEDLNSFKKDDKTYRIRFRSLRTDKILEINIKDGNKLSILTDQIELCGNLVQDFALFFNVENLNTNIHYSIYAKSYEEIFNRIELLDNERNHFNINMSDIITNIKDLFVKAEDNRLIYNIKGFRDYFRKIDVNNAQLLDEFEKRSDKYQQLLNDLKSVNEMIQLGSNLKCGTFKKAMVTECRKCIKNKDYKLLMRIISTGESK
jgi:Bardet-Biedl syndrome 2 protein